MEVRNDPLKRWAREPQCPFRRPRRISWSIVSNAADKSRRTIAFPFPSAAARCKSSRRLKRAVSVE
jgi:hypothetical protein